MTLLNGFMPSAGQSFDLFNGPTTGVFSQLTLPVLSNGLSWNTSNLYANGTISVVPEPSTLVLFGVGAIGLLVYGWRRRNRCPISRIRTLFQSPSGCSCGVGAEARNSSTHRVFVQGISSSLNGGTLMLRRSAMVLGFISFLASGVGAVLAQTFDQVTFSSQANFSWLGSGELPGAPTGPVTLGGIPFNIVSNGSGDQAWNASLAAGGGNGTESITMNPNVYGVSNVYTLINTWNGQSGPNYYVWLTFIGSGGATYTKDLVGNVDIRDYNNGSATNSINGTTTTNVFSDTDIYGGPGRLDMQNIAAPRGFCNPNTHHHRVGR